MIRISSLRIVTWCCTASLAVATSHAGAQTRPVALLAQVDGELKPLEVRSAAIDVHVEGLHALTTTTLVFGNPFNRVLEGEAVFPLQTGSAISGFGLDVDGEIVDAVAVERHAARKAFESEVRRAVDPGLVEWVSGSVFRTRVFPIPALSSRTVRVRYSSELSMEGDGTRRTALLRIPVTHLAPAGRIDVRIEVSGATGAPALQAAGRAIGVFDERSGRRILVSSAISATEDLTLTVPIAAASTGSTSRGPDGRTYFVIDDFPVVPPAPPAVTAARPLAGLLWDASLSRTRTDQSRELRLIEKWLQQVGNVDLQLTVLREVAEPSQHWAIRNGDAAALVRALQSIPFDGGTALDGLPRCERCAYQLLFSDGIPAVGEIQIHADGAAPIYVMSSGDPSQHAALKALAQATRGSYFNLAEDPDAAILGRLGRLHFSLLGIRTQSGQIVDVVTPRSDASSGHVSISGQLVTPGARLVLEYGWKPGEVALTRTVTLRPERTENALAPLIWAERRVADLSLHPRQERAELLRIGLAYRLATPATSLLVLETVEQYLRHGIEPPRSRTKLYAEYQARYEESAARRRESGAGERLVRIEILSDQWRRYIARVNRDPEIDEKSCTDFGPRGMRRRRSSLTGRVMDAADEILPGAEIEISGVCNGSSITVTAGSDGRYTARNLRTGRYRVTASLPGFVSATREAVLVPGYRSTVDLVLSVGSLTETISVSELLVGSETESDAVDDASSAPVIELKPWNPDTPYLAALKAAAPGDAYREYIVQRAAHAASPAFYLDCADYFLRQGNHVFARRLLTNIVELNPDDPALLRTAAHRLRQIGDLDLAITIFERVLTLRPEEPQSSRDIALALTDRADQARTRSGRSTASAALDYRRAASLLYDVATGAWDSDFRGIEIIALTEMNRILSMLGRDGVRLAGQLRVDPRLRHDVAADVRIVLGWDTDGTDMDLWVTEPSGELSDYNNKYTKSGGVHSDDLVVGYGPEEYITRQAMKGRYEISVEYFGSDSATLLGPTVLHATVFTNFARPTEQRRSLTLRLQDVKDHYVIGGICFESPGKTSAADAVCVGDPVP